MPIFFVLLIAIVIDVTLGDPPNVIHPVAWMGKIASLLERFAPKRGAAGQFLYGIVIVVVTASVFAVPAYFLFRYLEELNNILYVILGAFILKMTFSLRGLRQAAVSVKRLLLQDKLDEARAFELRALVKRDTRNLDKPLLVSATIESVAENLTDSFVAPLFYFLFLGIPGAIAYRAVNTLDAMIGYHGKYEYLGKFASRLDTVLNYLPARIAAFLVMLAALFSGKNPAASCRVAFKEHRKTESPNAGWTIAAAAGALGVRLEKVGYYKIGEMNPLPSVDSIDSSIALVEIAALVWTALCLTGGAVYLAVTT